MLDLTVAPRSTVAPIKNRNSFKSSHSLHRRKVGNLESRTQTVTEFQRIFSKQTCNILLPAYLCFNSVNLLTRYIFIIRTVRVVARVISSGAFSLNEKERGGLSGKKYGDRSGSAVVMSRKKRKT